MEKDPSLRSNHETFERSDASEKTNEKRDKKKKKTVSFFKGRLRSWLGRGHTEVGGADTPTEEAAEALADKQETGTGGRLKGILNLFRSRREQAPERHEQTEEGYDGTSLNTEFLDETSMTKANLNSSPELEAAKPSEKVLSAFEDEINSNNATASPEVTEAADAEEVAEVTRTLEEDATIKEDAEIDVVKSATVEPNVQNEIEHEADEGVYGSAPVARSTSETSERESPVIVEKKSNFLLGGLIGWFVRGRKERKVHRENEKLIKKLKKDSKAQNVSQIHQTLKTPSAAVSPNRVDRHSEKQADVKTRLTSVIETPSAAPNVARIEKHEEQSSSRVEQKRVKDQVSEPAGPVKMERSTGREQEHREVITPRTKPEEQQAASLEVASEAVHETGIREREQNIEKERRIEHKSAKNVEQEEISVNDLERSVETEPTQRIESAPETSLDQGESKERTAIGADGGSAGIDSSVAGVPSSENDLHGSRHDDLPADIDFDEDKYLKAGAIIIAVLAVVLLIAVVLN